MALVIAAVLVAFLLVNVLTFRLLTRIHPHRRAAILAVTIIGNAMWPFFPLLNARTGFSRFVRATLGPPWFAWTSWAIVYGMFVAIVAVAWLLFGRRIAFERFAHAPSRAFIIVTIVAGIVGVYQALVPLRVEHVAVPIANLPRELEGERIALMGDLHVGLFTRPSRLERIFRTVSSERPRVALIAGDLIDDDPHFVPKLLAGTRALDPQIPLFAVLGNHEMYGAPDEVIAQMRGSRIRLLVNEGAAAGRLWIAGISDYAARTPPLQPNVDAALANMPSGSLPLLLAHQPKAFADARARRLPLTVCAHTHGGQLGFRPLRWSLAGLFLPFHMGLYERGASQLYINTGTGYWLLPFRLGMTPEITIIELRAR